MLYIFLDRVGSQTRKKSFRLLLSSAATSGKKFYFKMSDSLFSPSSYSTPSRPPPAAATVANKLSFFLSFFLSLLSPVPSFFSLFLSLGGEKKRSQQSCRLLCGFFRSHIYREKTILYLVITPLFIEQYRVLQNITRKKEMFLPGKKERKKEREREREKERRKTDRQERKKERNCELTNLIRTFFPLVVKKTCEHFSSLLSKKSLDALPC